MLQIIDLDKYFLVFIDAYKRGLGGVLMQDGHVVCYESLKLNEHEKKYPTHRTWIEGVTILSSW